MLYFSYISVVALQLLYVHSKFVWQLAAEDLLYTLAPKKLLPKIPTQTCLPKTAKICAARTANWPKLSKKKLQKNIWYLDDAAFLKKYGSWSNLCWETLADLDYAIKWNCVESDVMKSLIVLYVLLLLLRSSVIW